MVDRANPDWPVVFQNEPISPQTDCFTVCILGLPRGGTTMVAGIAQRCGLWLGDDLPGNLEDQDFVGKPIDHLEDAILQRNNSHPVWGWKYPRAEMYLLKVLPILCMPRLIVVWRDPLAVSARAIKHGNPAKSAIPHFMKYYNANARLVSELNIPILHVSYEKSVREPLKCAEAIARFIGGRVPEEANELVKFAQPKTYK